MKLFRFFLFLICFLPFTTLTAQDLFLFMKQQDVIQQIEEIPGNSFFEHTYVVKIKQPLNYKDTTAGYFLQRVFIAEKGKSQPTVLITEGYAANYAKAPKYINELSEILDANQICVEHRYFGESYPDSIVWKYLTVENAANDHHRVVELFKPYFDQKWLNTGISKGGQTSLAHRTFFPNDVDLTVAYVAPLNFGVEDGRHEPFLKQVGTKECRDAIYNLQLEVLKRREGMKELLQKYCETRNYHSVLSYDELLDFAVLEYPFAFWQWGHSQDEIPPLTVSDEELFAHFSQISEPDYFTIEGGKPYVSFFYQAARELGYYGYDTKPFKQDIPAEMVKGWVNKYMIPENTMVTYHPETSLMVDKFLKTEARNVVLIYGEIDPWSATAATINSDPSNLKIVAPNGSHRTRINTLSPESKSKVIEYIQSKMINQ
ncbi:S28 family serine protease [Mangrovibacterium lignilyticum]|uniref:S28 family serine protease n=1 Tax=Mangrovibacterium lignilyticum TaxID=2668052 RepID=UPI0013D55FAC|nr:S28 family serine protease [Mangrovibacterium lignilyticum]